MERLSVTIITYNEEKMVRECLESVKWADEIVVVDSFSSDKTIKICKEFTCKIFQNRFPGHIEQKNIAIDKASHNWILSIDADERISSELENEIKTILKDRVDIEGFTVPRKSFYLGRWITHSGWYPNRNIRLFKKGCGRWGGINPHDSISVTGKTGKLYGDILHYPYKDIAHNMRTIDNFTGILAAEMYNNNKKTGLSDLVLRPILTFFKKYIINRGFLDGMPGFIICVLTSYYVFCKYAKLWETGLNNKQ